MSTINSNAVIEACIGRVVEDSKIRFKKVKKIDAVMSLVNWVFMSALLLMSIYWLGFGSGYADAFPLHHEISVKIIHAMPGQAEYIQSLLDDQGYVSLWQIRDITDRMAAQYGIK